MMSKTLYELLVQPLENYRSEVVAAIGKPVTVTLELDSADYDQLCHERAVGPGGSPSRTPGVVVRRALDPAPPSIADLVTSAS